MAGESCDLSSNTCEAYGCRDTHLDCEIGEICNANSGDCYDDPGGTCDSCTADENYDDQITLLFGGALSGQHCVQWDTNVYYWLALCNPNAAVDSCARGFTCVEEIYGDPSFSVDACIGDCTFYIDNGYL